MKDKLNEKYLKTSQKIKIITIAPDSWSRTKVPCFFFLMFLSTLWEKLDKLKTGYSRTFWWKKGQKLNEEVRQDAHFFYKDDEYSCMIAGMKDYVSLKVHKQNWLLLCNLNELYTVLKEKHPNSKIELSKFCSVQTK